MVHTMSVSKGIYGAENNEMLGQKDLIGPLSNGGNKTDEKAKVIIDSRERL